MNETLMITKYIAAWSWHLCAMIFLGIALIAAMLNKIPYILAMAIVICYCEFMALKRKNEVYENGE